MQKHNAKLTPLIVTFVNIEPEGVRTGANAFLSSSGGASSGSGAEERAEAANDAVFEMRRAR